uniref:Exostosin GT47 domain-containing protein n=1 Tax=Chromera velia CCMP2878 TaxID=1169474 RepID=A0A0G4GAM6_9ALVE|eukprot:Cvel_20925.t1-p1 / transcript=Cvel_20925.t1 / gene=Cvel_20925 / organism=Chromera_velia_CCMP2878 / gene_product=Probable beta-1,4-xylosyltransferase IRX10L, putative / transcript_product=Probable beta-1,4-xylosyltransferase IRX10L, putative / location=Cvel_scaffold1920:30493-32514(-) / protein_length=674 / sequence_SO=supercontig / SO=protein_coding / is_pseudo=false
MLVPVFFFCLHLALLVCNSLEVSVPLDGPSATSWRSDFSSEGDSLPPKTEAHEDLQKTETEGITERLFILHAPPSTLRLDVASFELAQLIHKLQRADMAITEGSFDFDAYPPYPFSSEDPVPLMGVECEFQGWQYSHEAVLARLITEAMSPSITKDPKNATAFYLFHCGHNVHAILRAVGIRNFVAITDRFYMAPLVRSYTGSEWYKGLPLARRGTKGVGVNAEDPLSQSLPARVGVGFFTHLGIDQGRLEMPMASRELSDWTVLSSDSADHFFLDRTKAYRVPMDMSETVVAQQDPARECIGERGGFIQPRGERDREEVNRCLQGVYRNQDIVIPQPTKFPLMLSPPPPLFFASYSAVQQEGGRAVSREQVEKRIVELAGTETALEGGTAWGTKTPPAVDLLFRPRPHLMFFGGTANSCTRKILFDRFGGQPPSSSPSDSDPSLSASEQKKPERDLNSFEILVANLGKKEWGMMGDKEVHLRVLMDSRFCLVPKGRGTVMCSRLYEAALFGCIPVVIGEDVHLPFSDFFNWNNAVVFVRPQEASLVEEIIRGISPQEELFLRSRLLELRFFIDFGSAGLPLALFNNLRVALRRPKPSGWEEGGGVKREYRENVGEVRDGSGGGVLEGSRLAGEKDPSGHLASRSGADPASGGSAGQRCLRESCQSESYHVSWA